MYIQAVCWPSGARVGSATDCWPKSMNGCSASPPPVGASASSTSCSEPPTCTVPASRASGAVQGTGPDSAQSTFKVAGPQRKRRRRLA